MLQRSTLRVIYNRLVIDPHFNPPKPTQTSFLLNVIDRRCQSWLLAVPSKEIITNRNRINKLYLPCQRLLISPFHSQSRPAQSCPALCPNPKKPIRRVVHNAQKLCARSGILVRAKFVVRTAAVAILSCEKVKGEYQKRRYRNDSPYRIARFRCHGEELYYY